MSPKKPRPKGTSRAGRRDACRAAARSLSALLAAVLCAPAAFAHASRAAAPAGDFTAGGFIKGARRSPVTDAQRLGQSQNPARPEPRPEPTPHVRQRTVAPKNEAEQQAAPAQTSQPAAAAPAPQPARAGEAAPPQSGAASGQTSEVVDEDEVVRVNSNLVIIPASVVDNRGRAITDLRVEDFELKIDGEVKPIGDLSRAETPVNVALLFDNSASLSAAREFEKQAAVRFFQSVVRPIDRAAVYSISTTPTLAQNLTNDVPRLVRTIERFGKPEGATALFDAVAEAADYMRPVPGRKVLVIVSDGTDTVSDATFEEAVNRALRAECQVYVVQTRQVEDPNLHDPVSEQRMYRLSEQTGGAVFIPRSVEDLDSVFRQISLDLSQQYLLSYYPQDERKDKYFRFISLRVKSRPHLRVRARKGFYPQSAQSGAGGAGAQFSGTLTNGATPEYVAASQTSQPNNASALLRRNAGPAPAVPERLAPQPGLARPGPDGPDTEEGSKTAARKASDVNEPTPTFTLRTTSSPASRPAPAETAQVLNGSGGARRESAPSTSDSAPPLTSSPAPSPTPVPSASPDASKAGASPVAGGRSESDAVERGAKAPAAEKAAGSAQPATAQPGGGERPKAPVSGGVLNGKAVSLPKPAYPAAAKNYGASGKVVVEVTIDEQGRVVEARAISGHPFLQQAAVQAARQARFTPATLSGEPVKVKGTINYVFALP